MKRKDIEKLAGKDDSQIRLCKIVEQNNTGITFLVDEGLSEPDYLYTPIAGHELAAYKLRNKQISDDLMDIVKCSFENESLCSFGDDVLYQCFIHSFAEHRPLVLTPDVIWIVIAQTLATHIHANADLLRSKIVRHDGKLDVIVKSAYKIDDSRTDWSDILDKIFSQIKSKTVNGIAERMVADYSTTGQDERIASVATLMHGIETYFTYRVYRCICGIPYITLKGTVEDWKSLMEKAKVLKEYGLSNWYRWLNPILKEFVRAANGKPHLDFWKNCVQIAHEDDFSTGRGCCPDYHYVNGWCVALFSFKDEDRNRVCYDRCLNVNSMAPEILRVGFRYSEIYPDGQNVEEQMELWSGIVGVEQDEKTHALTPKIGWFVRKSHEHEENIDRLKAADGYRGIDLEVDEVPDILKEFKTIKSLTLRFKKEVKIPKWLINKRVKHLTIVGSVDDEYKEYIKKNFRKVDFYNQ